VTTWYDSPFSSSALSSSSSVAFMPSLFVRYYLKVVEVSVNVVLPIPFHFFHVATILISLLGLKKYILLLLTLNQATCCPPRAAGLERNIANASCRATDREAHGCKTSEMSWK
jgi:hypothetical protein